MMYGFQKVFNVVFENVDSFKIWYYTFVYGASHSYRDGY